MEVVTRKRWYWPWSLWVGPVKLNENVTGALNRLGEKAQEVVMIAYFDYPTIRVLKAPKGYNAQSWLAEVQRRDIAEIKLAIVEAESDK